jgi:mRNA interferase RelE/StbE
LKYSIEITRRAQKALSKIAQSDQSKIISAIQSLADEPYPKSSKKLSGRDAWRIRIGNYRVIYEVDHGVLSILVVLIGHRKDIYRK